MTYDETSTDPRNIAAAGWCGETRPHTHGLSEGIITYTDGQPAYTDAEFAEHMARDHGVTDAQITEWQAPGDDGSGLRIVTTDVDSGFFGRND